MSGSVAERAGEPERRDGLVGGAVRLRRQVVLWRPGPRTGARWCRRRRSSCRCAASGASIGRVRAPCRPTRPGRRRRHRDGRQVRIASSPRWSRRSARTHAVDLDGAQELASLAARHTAATRSWSRAPPASRRPSRTRRRPSCSARSARPPGAGQADLRHRHLLDGRDAGADAGRRGRRRRRAARRDAVLQQAAAARADRALRAHGRRDRAARSSSTTSPAAPRRASSTTRCSSSPSGPTSSR